MSPEDHPGGRPRGAILTLGLGTSVAMWDAAFLACMPALGDPRPQQALQQYAPLILAAFALLLVVGGVLAGRLVGGWRTGALVGATAQTVNLLVLGALLGDRSLADALLWVPGSLLAGAALATLGAVCIRPVANDTDWSAALASVAVAAIVSVVVVGGLVTGLEVGMAVPDWPQTFGWLMWLYPLSRMANPGIYFEHSHRLMGSLAGLAVMLVCWHVWRTTDCRGRRRLALLALVMVIVQGTLGGYRVRLGNVSLAAFHGVFAQCVLAVAVCLRVLLDRRWTAADLPATRQTRGDALFGRLVVGVMLIQIALGALQRHHGIGLWAHIFWALPTAMLAVNLGGRAIEAVPAGLSHPLRSGGRALVGLTGLQLILGFASVIAIRLPRGDGPNLAEVSITTLHQTTGALLFASLAWTVSWLHRQPPSE